MGGVPVDVAVRIILEEALKSGLEEIVLVAWSEEDFETFQRVAAQMDVEASLGETL